MLSPPGGERKAPSSRPKEGVDSSLELETIADLEREGCSTISGLIVAKPECSRFAHSRPDPTASAMAALPRV